MEESDFKCPHVESGEATTGFVIDLSDDRKLYLCGECYEGFKDGAGEAVYDIVTDTIDRALREAIDN